MTVGSSLMPADSREELATWGKEIYLLPKYLLGHILEHTSDSYNLRSSCIDITKINYKVKINENVHLREAKKYEETEWTWRHC